MIPVLYSETEKDFGHNGIGVLTYTLDYEVTEEANGEFELYLEYPADSQWASELKDQRLIKAKPNDMDAPHIFRIYEIIKNLNEQTIYIYATTRTNDLAGNLVLDVTVSNKTAQEAMTSIKDNLVEPTDFNFVSDIQTRSSTRWTRRNPLNCIVGEDDSLVKYWGGEVKRTNDTIYLYSRRGRDNVTVLRQGKNLEGFEMTVSTKGLITRILPYFSYVKDDSDETITVVGSVVDSPLVNNYPVRSIMPVDYSDDASVTDLASLNNAAKRYFSYRNPDSDKPTVNTTVDLLQLVDSAEYAKFKGLETIGLFDTVTVWVEKYNVDVTVKINKVVYNGLKEQVVRVYAGNPKGGLYSDIRKQYTQGISELRKYVDGVENGIRNVIQMSADGVAKIFRGYTEPPIEIVNVNDLWYKEIGNGEVEVYIFNGLSWDALITAGLNEATRLAVENALAEAEQAKTDAEQAYTDAVAEADRLVIAQTEAFDAEMTLRKGEITAIQNDIDAELVRVDQAISDNFTSLSDTLDDVDAISKQAKSDAQTAASNAATALSNAQTAISTATSANNKAIKSSVIEWALSASGTTPPTTGWSTTVPTPSTTQYTWGRTTITLNDGTTIPSYTVSKMGVKGDPGAPGAGGAKGDKGDAGLNAPKITAVKQYFYLSSSNTSQTGGSWTETIPVWSSGKYYWTRVVTTYDNATTTESVPVLDNSLNQSLVTSLEAKSATQTLSTTVSQHATQIAAKASQTTVDSLTGRVSTAEGSISIQAGQIALKASQTSVDSLTGRVGTSETNISANATAINLRATKASVDTLTGRVSAAEASISVQAGKIDLAATKTELTTAVNGIEVGAKNLLLKSNVAVTNQAYPTATYSLSERMIAGQVYTIRLWGTLGTGKTNFTSYLNGGSIGLGALKNNGDGTFSLTFVGKSSGVSTGDTIHIYPLYSTVLVNSTITKIKLEKGNKATDWTPAPEDVDTSIATVQSNLTVEAGKITAVTARVSGTESSIATVKQTADGNKATVANHTGQISTINQTVGGLQTLVADKADKSQITQLSNSISSVVTDLSNVDVIDQPGVTGKTFRNVHTFENSVSNVSGMVRINTPITNSAMVTIRFTGYNYQGNRSTIDLTVSFYAYNTTAILQHSYTNRGDFAITDVRVGRDGSGRAVILLGVPTTNWSYPSIDVEYVKVSFMSPPDSWKDGWSSATTTVTTGITALTTIQGMDTQSRITQNATNINLRVTKGEVVSQLNIDAGRVLIQTNKLLLDANTYIMGTTFANDIKAKSIEAVNANIASIRTSILAADVITSGMVATSTALVTKIFATDATVTTLTGKTAFINSIKAITISADKITTGTLNAANVNITNLNASNITTGKITGLEIVNQFSYISGISTQITGTTTMNGLYSMTYILPTSGQTGSMRFDAGGIYANHLAANGSRLWSWEVGSIGLTTVNGAASATYSSNGVEFRPSTGAVSKLDFDTSNWRIRISSANGVELGAMNGGVYSRRISSGGWAGTSVSPFVDIWSTLNMQQNIVTNTPLIRLTNDNTSSSGSRLMNSADNWLIIGGRWGTRIGHVGENGSSVYEIIRVPSSGAVVFLRDLNMNGGSVTGTSDRRMKTNIATTIETGLENIRRWNFVDFDWRDVNRPRGRQFGLIAQEAVGIGFEGEDGTWQINSSKQTMLNSLGIKELDAKVTRVEKFVTQHELEIELLKERIKQLEEKIA